MIEISRLRKVELNNMSSEYIVFDDYCKVSDVDNTKYERVGRLTSHGSEDTNITLDINTELYPVAVNDNLHIQLAQSLSPEMRDAAEYIMYGKIYRFDEGKGDKTNVFISFGGLLMRIEGSYRRLSRMQHGDGKHKYRTH